MISVLAYTIVSVMNENRRKRLREERYRYGGRARSKPFTNTTSGKSVMDEVFALAERIARDWKLNRYTDKVSTRNYRGKVSLYYRFEDGTDLEFNNSYGERHMIHTTRTQKITYTLSPSTWAQMVSLMNTLVEQCNNGIAKDRGRTRTKPSGSSSQTTNPHANHPKWEKYYNLTQTIEARKDNLAKMSKNDPDRPQLENELNVAKTTAKKLKEKYNF